MNIFIIYLIILILAGVIAYFLLKTILKTVLILFLVLLFLSIFTTFSITKEVNDLKTNLPSSNNLILLENNNAYLTGVYFNIKSSQFTPLTEDELNSIQNKNLEEIQPTQEIYKIIKINYNYLESNLPENLEVQNISLSKTEFNIQMTSENPLNYYVYQNNSIQVITSIEPTQNYLQISNLFNSTLEYKTNLFLISLQSIENNQNILNFFISGLKTDQIIIYKETLTFKILESIPNSILEKITKK